jgi:outer membrane protein insertion porin family
LFAVALSFTAHVGASVANAAVINNIKVVGNKRVEQETVLSYLGFRKGDKYNASRADASIKDLFATGLFSDVQIRPSGGTLVVTVEENPIINKVAFEGNREVKDETLASEVQLRQRAIYTKAKARSDAQRILDVYQRQGMFSANVVPKIIRLEHNRVNLVFEINEGSSTKVRAISFIGNRDFSDSQLRDIITTSETGLLSFLSHSNVYDPDRLNLDRELLRQFYLKNGYADARVVSAVADLDRDGSGFYITFTIEEGDLYRFGNVEVESSLPALDMSVMQDKMSTHPGRIYNAAKIDKTTEALTLAAAESGYAFARVRPRVDRDPLARTIGLTYVVEEGPRVYIERISISGNLRTEDKVIRREFRLAEGDAYNRLMVQKARRRLMGLGFFKKVEIGRQPGGAPDRVVLDVKVLEQSTGDLAFSAGYSTSEGVVGDVSFTERNFMGKGQFVRLKLSGSFERGQFDFSFTEPRFMERNLSLGFDAFHKVADKTDDYGYKSQVSGGGLRLGFALADDSWLSTRYRFVRDEIYGVENTASQDIKEAEGTTYISSVGYTGTYDTRDHKRKPTRGYYLSLSQDLAGVGGDVSYLRSVVEGRAYYPLWEKVTLVGRAIGGHIEGWDGEEVRHTDRFSKGGETVRGFDKSGFGPRDRTTGDPLGGKIFMAGTVEMRFPIPIIPENLGFSGAVFADAGTLYDPGDITDKNYDDDSSIRSSIGGSLLWDSPMGPLRADIAYILSEEEYDDTELFRFGAATKF